MSATIAGDRPCHLRDPPESHNFLMGIGEVIGEMISKRFVINELLYESKHMRVASALDLQDPGIVAVKLARSEVAAEALTQEAFYLSKLLPYKIPGIPKIVYSEKKVLVTTPVGINLAVLEHQARQAGSPLPPSCLDQWKTQLQTIIRQMHQAGVIHRDIKPANLILHEKQLYLIDFDSATSVSKPSSEYAGTLQYMSSAAKQKEPATITDDWVSLNYTMLALTKGVLKYEN